MALSDSSTQKEFYNSVNPDYLSYKKNIPYARYLSELLLSMLPPPRNSVLEVGAGQGRFTFELSKYLKHLTATDISEREIALLRAQAKRLKRTNIAARVLDLLNIGQSLRTKQFDHIIGIFILHHLPKEKLPMVINSLSLHLKRNGRLCFIENNNLSPAHLVAIAIRKDMTWEVEKGAYTNYISWFDKACRISGLQVISKRKFGFFPPQIINRWPWITGIEKILEYIPLIREVACPFILLTAQKV